MISDLIEPYDRIDHLTRGERNGLIFNTYSFLKEQSQSVVRKSHLEENDLTLQVPIDTAWTAEAITDLTKALLLYSREIIFFVEGSFGYLKHHTDEEADEESGGWGRTYYREEGSLSLDWLINLLRELQIPMEANLVKIATSYLVERIRDEDTTAGPNIRELLGRDRLREMLSNEVINPTILSPDIEQEFGDLLARTMALPLLQEKHEKRFIRRLKKQPATTLSKAITWRDIELSSKYWQHLYESMGLPYLRDLPMSDILKFRDDERDLFDTFNSRIARSIREMSPEHTEDKITSAVQETIEGFIEIKETFDRKLRRSAALSALSVATLGISIIGLVTGPGALIPTISTIVGSGTLLDLISKATTLLDVRSARRMHRSYIPLRLTEFLQRRAK